MDYLCSKHGGKLYLQQKHYKNVTNRTMTTPMKIVAIWFTFQFIFFSNTFIIFFFNITIYVIQKQVRILSVTFFKIMM